MKDFLYLFIIMLIIEPLIINVIYFSNVQLFLDIILWKRNVKKLKEFLSNEKK